MELELAGCGGDGFGRIGQRGPAADPRRAGSHQVSIASGREPGYRSPHVETEHGRNIIYDDGHLIECAVLKLSELEITRANDYRVAVDCRPAYPPIGLAS